MFSAPLFFKLSSTFPFLEFPSPSIIASFALSTCILQPRLSFPWMSYCAIFKQSSNQPINQSTSQPARRTHHPLQVVCTVVPYIRCRYFNSQIPVCVSSGAVLHRKHTVIHTSRIPHALRPCILHSLRCLLSTVVGQTLRSAIAALNKHRQELTSYHLHSIHSTAATNMDNFERRCAVALGRASVTTDFNNVAVEETNTGGLSGHRGDPADPGFHELAAVQLVCPSCYR